MFQENLFKDKTIVITGGASGLGLAMAKLFAALGARLVLASRSQERLKSGAAQVSALGRAPVETFQLDVRDPDAVERFAASVENKCGHVDALVNNAAGNFLAASEDLSTNAFRSVVETVLHGSFFCSQAFGRQMIRHHRGAILNIVATYAWTGSSFVLPSACAKAGVLAMTQSLAVEWATYGIRVNAIAPGMIPTQGAFSRLMPPALEQEAKRRIPDGRYGTPEELANLAAFLLADESAHINGEVVALDGGEWLSGTGFNDLARAERGPMKQLFASLKPRKS